MYYVPCRRCRDKAAGDRHLYILLNGYNRCSGSAAVIWFQEVSVYGSAESSYLISYPVGPFRQDGGDGVRTFPSRLKFGMMLHDLGFVIIEYKVSYFENMWSFHHI